MHRWLLIVVAAAGCLLPGPAAPARADGERLVLAFYYAWFDPASWRGKTSDAPPTPYNSDDAEVMARHVAQAQSAGIDALVLNWWGKGNRTEKNLKALLEVAGGRGFRVAAVLDLNSPTMKGTAAYADNLRHLLSVHAAHPAYLRWNGRPVVFFYNVARLPVATWRSVRDQADPDHASWWIAEGTDVKYLSVFDGHHLYSITWPNRIAPAKTLASWGERVRAYNRDHGTAKLWVATVMPGYDDRGVRPKGGFARGRAGGEYYVECWQAAIASRPSWVIVNSFNEWAEGTQIEPGVTHGRQYLDLTAEWAGRFRAADLSSPTPPKPAAVRKPAPPTPTPAPTLAPTPTLPPLPPDPPRAPRRPRLQPY